MSSLCCAAWHCRCGGHCNRGQSVPAALSESSQRLCPSTNTLVYFIHSHYLKKFLRCHQQEKPDRPSAAGVLSLQHSFALPTHFPARLRSGSTQQTTRTTWFQAAGAARQRQAAAGDPALRSDLRSDLRVDLRFDSAPISASASISASTPLRSPRRSPRGSCVRAPLSQLPRDPLSYSSATSSPASRVEMLRCSV